MTNPAPPKFVEFLVGRLLPRPCREPVLGDIHERYRSFSGYVADAASAVPAAIVSQIHRATPIPFLLMEALVVYGSFLAAALWTRRIDGPPDLLWVASVTVIVMAGLLWRDAYSTVPNRDQMKLMVKLKQAGLKLTPPRLKLIAGMQLIAGVYLTIYFSSFVSMALGLISPALFSFTRINATQTGAFISGILISLLRVWIETLRRDRLRGAH